MLHVNGVSTVYRMLGVLLASGLLALVQGLVIDNADLSYPVDAYMVSLEEAEELGNAIWVDARGQDAYQSGHYPGAIRLSEDDWDAGLSRILSSWDFEQPLIVYCDGGDCASSREFAKRLREEVDTEAVFWLQDGWQVLRETIEK